MRHGGELYAKMGKIHITIAMLQFASIFLCMYDIQNYN